jgi:hypothetical protein
MALTAMCGWQQLILLGFWIALWLGYHLVARQWNDPGRILAGLVLAFVICASLTFPLLWPVVNEGLVQGEGSLQAGALGDGGTDLAAYLVPGDTHPLLRLQPVREIHQRLFRVGNTSRFLGFTALGLMLWAICRQWTASAFWMVVIAGTVTMALGPELRMNGVAFRWVPMPYRLVAQTLVGRVLRRPARLNAIMSMAAAVLVGFGASDILRRLAGGSWRQVSALVATATLVFTEQLAIPFPTTAALDSTFYEELRHEPGEFAIADFPIGYLAHDKWYMFGQTRHGRPMVGGHVSRVPPDAHEFIDRVPVLTEARGSAPNWGELDDISQQLEPLSNANVKYVLFHKHRASVRRESVWREWFATYPAYEDQRLVVFRTAPQHGDDFEFASEIGDGIGVVEAELSTTVLPQEGLLEAKVVWGTRDDPTTDWQAYVALTNSENEQVQRTPFEPCEGWSTSRWGSNSLARGEGSLEVDPYLRRGNYQVKLGLVEPVSGKEAGEPMQIGQLELQAIERVFDTPEVATSTDVTFGGVLRLLGYDLQKEADGLELALHWKALRRMEESFTFFVHLVDTETGELVSQADVIPHDWTYPTTWWEAGEVVSVDVDLSKESQEEAAYRLEIGVYHGDTGERLPPTSADHLDMDRLVLPKTIDIP